jgi:hypothetical protein
MRALTKAALKHILWKPCSWFIVPVHIATLPKRQRSGLAKLGRPVKKMIGGITGWSDEGFSLVNQKGQ